MTVGNQPPSEPDELAAPLDLLLTSATRPFVGRMMPNATWTRFVGNLAQRPRCRRRQVARSTRELGTIAAGQVGPRSGACRQALQSTLRGNRIRCCTEPCRPIWQLPRRLKGCSPTPQLDWRDTEKMRFVLDNFVEGPGAEQQPADQPAGLEGADRHRRSERGARAAALRPRHAVDAAGAGDGGARRVHGGGDRGRHRRGGGAANRDVRADPVRPADTTRCARFRC